MPLTRRNYMGEADWTPIATLIASDPYFHHPIDFPWRLTSSSVEDHRNAAIWVDEDGQMRAFGALQFAWLTLDYAMDPAVRIRELEAEILDWGEQRLRQIATDTIDHFPFNVSAYPDEHERVAFLEQRGYTRWENYLIVFNRSLHSIPKPQLPRGFSIRPLADEGEVDEYVTLHRAAFNSTTMTKDWRRRTFHAPLYNPALDLVAVAPDGRLAGFIVCWVQPHRRTAQIEPMGVHPDFQQLGLSQALMNEGFRRVADAGAEIVRVETYNFSQAAVRAYTAAGFEITTQKNKYYLNY